MNWQHFKSFLWLRWRLAVNQLRRSGIANLVVLILLTVAGLLASAAMFVGFFCLGLWGLDDVVPLILMVVWDGLVFVFLLLWMVGLLLQFQRSEALSLDKLLHYPVSLRGAFLLNYLSSLLGLTMILLFPGMLGLAVGLVFSHGPRMLLQFPLLAAFVLMVSALTHQFRGWLAALMSNKRRRRTVLTVVALIVLVVSQLPILIHMVLPTDIAGSAAAQQELDELKASLDAKKISVREYNRQKEALAAAQQRRSHQEHEELKEQIEWWATVGNLAAPPGWLPYGAMAAADGDFLAVFLTFAGMSLIGALSLRRSYKTTLRLYMGGFTSGTVKPAALGTPAPGGKVSVAFLERKLPWISEHASAIALAMFRSMLRAPEAKLMALSPLVLAFILGALFLTQSMDPPEFLRPLMACGAISVVLLTMLQFAGNQFGLDRSGFRTFVLCAAPRRDILLGKNLAFAPLGLTLSLFLAVALQVVYPMRWEHFFAMFPTAVSMCLIFCAMANWLSIFGPMAIASGSLQPSRPKGVILLLQLLFTTLFPIALAPTLLPLGVEYVLERLDWMDGPPTCLILSLFVLAAVVVAYRLMLTWQGRVLHAREQIILEIVTAKTE